MSLKLRLSPLLLVAGSAIAWLCLISPQSCSAQAKVLTQNFRLPVTVTQYLPGVGNTYMEAELHVVSRTTITPSGKTTAEFHVNLGHFDGVVTDSGTKLQGQEVINETSFSTADPWPWEGTFTVMFTAITAGSADNFIETITVHVTVNANGETTAEVENVRP